MNNKHKVNDLVLADNLNHETVIGCITSINHEAEWGYTIHWSDGVETVERESVVDGYIKKFKEHTDSK